MYQKIKMEEEKKRNKDVVIDRLNEYRNIIHKNNEKKKQKVKIVGRLI